MVLIILSINIVKTKVFKYNLIKVYYCLICLKMKYFLFIFLFFSLQVFYYPIERLPDAYKFSGINEKLDKSIISSVNLYNSEGKKWI